MKYRNTYLKTAITMLQPLLKKEEVGINILTSLNYRSFKERQNNIIDYLNRLLSKEMTDFLSFPVYSFDQYFPAFEKQEFEGIYRLGLMSDFIGNIPEKNQIEINERIGLLRSNPFLDYVNLMILAPMNNFASESNIKAIDPIVFAVCKIKDKNYLVPLSQWD